jgi:hypothetical protein
VSIISDDRDVDSSKSQHKHGEDELSNLQSPDELGKLEDVVVRHRSKT